MLLEALIFVGEVLSLVFEICEAAHYKGKSFRLDRRKG